jgi:hypothetical protein
MILHPIWRVPSSQFLGGAFSWQGLASWKFTCPARLSLHTISSRYIFRALSRAKSFDLLLKGIYLLILKAHLMILRLYLSLIIIPQVINLHFKLLIMQLHLLHLIVAGLLLRLFLCIV